MMDPVLRFIRKAVVSYRALFGWIAPQAYILIMVISPILKLSFYLLIVKYVYDVSDLKPWVIGNALMLSSMNALFGVGPQLSDERGKGTLKLLIASPSSTVGTLLPRAFLHMLNGILSVSIGLAAGAMLFGLRLALPRIVLLYLFIGISSFSMMGLGLCISSIGLITRDMNFVMNLLTELLLLCTGANILIEDLPVLLQWISQILPLTSAIEAGRLIAEGAVFSNVLHLFMREAAIGIIYSLLGIALFAITEHSAKQHASLDVV